MSSLCLLDLLKVEAATAQMVTGGWSSAGTVLTWGEWQASILVTLDAA